MTKEFNHNIGLGWPDQVEKTILKKEFNHREEICENCGKPKEMHDMVYGKYYYCDTKHAEEFKLKK